MEDTGPHMILCATPSRSWTKSIEVFCILCVFEEETSLQCAWLYCAWFAFIVCLIGKIPNQRLNCISLCRKTSDDSGCSNILTPPRPTVSVRRQSCGKSGGQDVDSRKNTYSGGQNENHKQSYSSKRKNLEVEDANVTKRYIESTLLRSLSICCCEENVVLLLWSAAKSPNFTDADSFPIKKWCFFATRSTYKGGTYCMAFAPQNCW